MRVLLFALAILLPVGAGVAVYVLWPVADEPESAVELPSRPPAPLPKQHSAARFEVAPPPGLFVAARGPEVAPPPRVAVAPAAPVEPVAEPADGVIALNNPNGEYVLPDAIDLDAVALTGEIGVLKIGRVSGRAVVDATKLRAKVVIVSDRVDGEGVLRMRATERIEFHGRIDGAATVTAEAPGGAVRFTTEAARIDGGAKVLVSAAKVEFVGKVDGGSRLTVSAGEVVFGGEKLGGGRGSPSPPGPWMSAA